MIDACLAATRRQTGRSEEANEEQPLMNSGHPAETGDAAGIPETERE